MTMMKRVLMMIISEEGSIDRNWDSLRSSSVKRLNKFKVACYEFC